MDLDQILDKLIADVEASIHAFYRGEVRQDTQRAKSTRQRSVAREAIVAWMGNGTAAAPGAVAGTRTALAPDELAAVTRCVIAWLPMGAPSTTNPASKCVPAARELAPTWAEREKAQVALKRLAN